MEADFFFANVIFFFSFFKFNPEIRITVLLSYTATQGQGKIKRIYAVVLNLSSSESFVCFSKNFPKSLIIDNFISQKNVQRIAKKHKVRQFELRQLKEKLKKNLRLKSFFRLTRLAHGYFGCHNLVTLLMPCRFRLREIEKRF